MCIRGTDVAVGSDGKGRQQEQTQCSQLEKLTVMQSDMKSHSSSLDKTDPAALFFRRVLNCLSSPSSCVTFK